MWIECDDVEVGRPGTHISFKLSQKRDLYSLYCKLYKNAAELFSVQVFKSPCGMAIYDDKWVKDRITYYVCGELSSFLHYIHHHHQKQVFSHNWVSIFH
jgi:hypothetical protein